MKKPTFGICAPSSCAVPENLTAGIEKLRALGHDLVIHPQAHGRWGQTQLAGTVDEKITALYDLMGDPNVDMVLTACGGQTAGHLLDRLDFSRLTKPIIGYSDTTALLVPTYHQTGRIQYHGPGATWFRGERVRDDLYQQMMSVLMGTATDIPLMDSVVKKPGMGTGRLIGGNLIAFQHLLHTPWCPSLDGTILFFEDVGDELSSIDRILNYFRLLGLFDRAAGVIFGQFTNMKDTGRPFGFTMDEIIATHTAAAKCPIVTNGPFGHSGLLVTFPVGAMATLDARGGTPTLRLQ
jgi:muramoyltetrapeptide carboxypeptidase